MTFAEAEAPAVYVITKEIQEAVKGNEITVLQAVGIAWDGRQSHITCPYPGHGGENDWRWDDRKGKAFCTCIGSRPGEKGSHSLFDAVACLEGSDFDTAKIRVAEIIGRTDLFRGAGKTGKSNGAVRGRSTDAVSLMAPPAPRADRRLPLDYLAHRLGVDRDQVPVPSTPITGWTAFPYFDPPPSAKAKPKLVGEYPCAVFGTVGADGKTHAHRIYVAPGGAGKAELGKRDNGEARDPKKSAKVGPNDNISGRSVLWGDPHKAPHLIVTEGIETGVAVALVFWAEIQANKVVVAAAISAVSVEAVKPWPATRKITVAADRDEAQKRPGKMPTRRGEYAARKLAVRHHEQIAVSMSLPGKAGEAVDWLDVLRSDGVDAVRQGIEAAERIVPRPEEIEAEQQRDGKLLDLAEVKKIYVLPAMDSMEIEYRYSRNGEIWAYKRLGDIEDKTTGETQVRWQKIATPFGMPARLRYIDNASAYGLRVVVQDMTGEPRALDIERAALGRAGGAEIKAQLYNAGLMTEGDGDAIVVAALKATRPKDEIAVVSKPGWHELDGLADPIYVTPSGEVIGAPEGVLIELAMSNRVVGAQSGTIEGWKQAVKAASNPTNNCPHWIIGVVAGFAGAITALTGLDTCGINISGKTSGGKSTSQRLAVSAWTNPKQDKGLLQSMRSTENAIEALSEMASGSVLALDEMAHADGQMVGRMIYMIAGGVGKTRMNANATLKNRYSWQTFAVLSSECSLEQKVTRDGGKWQAGMAARFADIDITGTNEFVPRDTVDIIEQFFYHYGHAGPEFVRRLVKEGLHRKGQELRDEINREASRLAGENASGAVIRSALALAILRVSGELARTLGLLPADIDLPRAIGWAWNKFQDFADAMALSPEDQAFGHIQRWLLERWDQSVQPIDPQKHPIYGGERTFSREAVAWYDAEAIYIHAARIVEAAGGILKEQQIVKAIHEKGWLIRKNDPTRNKTRYVTGIGEFDGYALSRKKFGRNKESKHLHLIAEVV